MMQRSVAIAIILGALIIAAALVFHGRQLAEVSRRLEAMDQRTTTLDARLAELSRQLPTLIQQAGKNAGRQAVHGMVEEALQMPLNWLRSKPVLGKSNILERIVSFPHASEGTADQGPSVRFDIREPVVKIEILPKLKTIPSISWPPIGDKTQASTQTDIRSPQLDVTPVPRGK